MKVVIDPGKSIYDNASGYFDRAKKLKRKIAETEKAIARTKEELKKIEEGHVEEAKQAAKGKEKAREWFEGFHWFVTSDGHMAVGGRSADQNESLVKSYLSENDLFFHADIAGASVFVLKNGVSAPQRSVEETAQFAACYSNAWKEGLSTIGVYAVRKEQVSKSALPGEHLPHGSFMIRGEKRMFKNVVLKFLIGLTASGIQCVPAMCGADRFSTCYEFIPGADEKERAAGKIAQVLGVEKEKILPLIPAGKTSARRMK